MHAITFRFSQPRLCVLLTGTFIGLSLCVSVSHLMAQSSVRELNTKRQIPSFLRRPLARLARNDSDSSIANTGNSDILDDAFFEQYEAQLNAILKTRLDEEREFVKGVVDQVREENITTRLINTSFKWVRNKRPNVKNSFVYFERVLRILADSQGVGEFIPEFDPRIYSESSARTLP